MFGESASAGGQDILGNIIDAVVQQNRAAAFRSPKRTDQEVETSVVQGEPHRSLDGLAPIAQRAPMRKPLGQLADLPAGRTSSRLMCGSRLRLPHQRPARDLS